MLWASKVPPNDKHPTTNNPNEDENVGVVRHVTYYYDPYVNNHDITTRSDGQ